MRGDTSIRQQVFVPGKSASKTPGHMDVFVQIEQSEDIHPVEISEDITLGRFIARTREVLGLRDDTQFDLTTADGTTLSDDVGLREACGQTSHFVAANLVNPAWKDCVVPGEASRFRQTPTGKECCKVEDMDFPEPSGIQVNMMPFRMRHNFSKTGLPDYLQPYFDAFIRPLESSLRLEVDKICYLSVDERFVKKGEHHRRPGLHTECPGRLQVRGLGSSKGYSYYHSWGFALGHMKGGIYMASNVGGTCQGWNCKIMEPEDESLIDTVIRPHGDVAHLRQFLPEDGRTVMEEGAVYWLSDRTPHESLPMPEDGTRQWVRLVTSQVSAWFADHSTPNPNGIVPDPSITKIVTGCKFEPDSLEVVA